MVFFFQNDEMINSAEKCLVSACLVGLCTRYDGRCKPDTRCLRHLEDRCWLPVCPEQLGGLPTPRTPADLVGGDGHGVLAGKARVIDAHGHDVSAAFVRGAEQVLKIARARNITHALLKSGSPSCGIGDPVGVTAALLLENNITCTEYG